MGKESIAVADFGVLRDGRQVKVYTLTNQAGLEARILDYGGIVVSLKVPDRQGRLADVVMGFDSLSDYETKSPYFGSLIGRYGNRIANASFSLGGRTYRLAANNGCNALHGGLKGFDKAVWAASSRVGPEGPALGLNYVSPDGEEGYPGTLSVSAVYTLTRDNGLALDFTAVTDRDTVVNLTHHSYFNLAGKGDVLGYLMQLEADAFTPVSEALIPTGEIRSVAGTPFDFRQPVAIGAHIDADDEQLRRGKGYDHNWILRKKQGELGRAATVHDPVSGRVMEVFTTEPAMQVYTANCLDGAPVGKGGWVYRSRQAFCIEPQHYPDSPNQPTFPSTVLKPGQTFTSRIEYRFSAR